ncbi:hypothetical protein FKB34_01740 [Glycocaulis profundi]|nr:hypothetical protein FKB34_01740 [Glycocaulis profundi]
MPYRLEPVWAFFALLGGYLPAILAAAASVTVVIVEAHGILLPLGGMLCGAGCLFYIRRKLPMRSRAFYAIASFFAALPFVWPASDLARHFWPFLPPSVAFAIGFLCMLTVFPLVAVLRAGTKQVEEDPQAVLGWLWRRLPKEWRGGRDADKS